MQRLWEDSLTASRAGRWAESERLLRKIVASYPTSKPALHNLAVAVIARGDAVEAEGLFRRALDLDPACVSSQHGLYRALMTQGRYVEALPLSASRYGNPATGMIKPAYARPEWCGEPLSGKRIAVFPEQGRGDEIQYARFAADLMERGASVTWLCHPSLYDLFSESLSCDVVAASGQTQFQSPDLWTTNTDVNGLLGIDRDQLSGAAYLKAANPLSGGGIGVVTRGRPTHRNDARRSLSADDAEHLKSVIGPSVSLHPDDTGFLSFAEIANIIAGLDLVVTVDTVFAHLAGAMGKPVWILIPAIDTDWRWGSSGASSPWYDAARLFRSDGESWTGAINQIAAALLLASR